MGEVPGEDVRVEGVPGEDVRVEGVPGEGERVASEDSCLVRM